MKCSIPLALLLGLTSCSGADVGESVGAASEALNGDFSPQGFLTIKGNGLGSSNESTRRADTLTYYASTNTRLGSDGLGRASIDPGLNTLTKFRTGFGFGGGQFPETQAFYYNKGDLGLGREMHCIDRNDLTDRQIACYVTNYAAGDDFGEFTFGLSRDVAFANMDAVPPRVLATVAMVYRQQARIGLGRDQMLFMAYNAQGNLTDNAPLDRHGINFANGFAAAGGTPDAAVFGTPGVNLNNHIPSNCLNCHGGQYNPSAHSSSDTPSVSAAVFLPWDLEQLEYEPIAGRTQSAQEPAFRALNELARRVAANVRGADSPIVNQIDGWYGNTSHGSTLSGNFNPGYVPPGWSAGADAAVYHDVVRRSCRGCHVASQAIPFEDANSFLALCGSSNGNGDLLAHDLVSHKMPHALQTQREFWLSSQPELLNTYLRGKGKLGAADILAAGSPGGVVTLDPYAITAATSL